MTNYVIVDKETMHRATNRNRGLMTADSEAGIKRLRTRAIRAGLLDPKYEIMTMDEFHALDCATMVTVKSLMTGVEVQIRRSEKGGCTDPSTERFWSM